MGAIVRQQYIDPQSGNLLVREMVLDIEVVRPENAKSMDSVFYVTIDPVPIHHIPNSPTFSKVFVSPEEIVSQLIDGKRTANPYGCKRSRLLTKNEGNRFIVENVSEDGLDPRVGDPIAVFDKLGTRERPQFGIIESVSNNTVILQGPPFKTYFQGAVIENLAERYHNNKPALGAKSQLQRPFPCPFRAVRKAEYIDVMISKPMVVGVLKSYDIYIRTQHFNEVEYHWVPDSSISVGQLAGSHIEVKTYNGGAECGGGNVIEYKGPLFVAVLCKDGHGFNYVNESGFEAISV